MLNILRNKMAAYTAWGKNSITLQCDFTIHTHAKQYAGSYVCSRKFATGEIILVNGQEFATISSNSSIAKNLHSCNFDMKPNDFTAISVKKICYLSLINEIHNFSFQDKYAIVRLIDNAIKYHSDQKLYAGPRYPREDRGCRTWFGLGKPCACVAAAAAEYVSVSTTSACAVSINADKLFGPEYEMCIGIAMFVLWCKKWSRSNSSHIL